jgi:hypothetical protein
MGRDLDFIIATQNFTSKYVTNNQKIIINKITHNYKKKKKKKIILDARNLGALCIETRNII